MLFLLRKIRNKLLKENKIKSYLLYAIGEIFLVVIGILIAVQINTWSTNQKNEQIRREYLQALTKDLKQDSLALAENMVFINEDLDKLSNLTRRLSSDVVTMDTVRQIARYEFLPFFEPANELNRSTITTLISSGDIKLFNEELKSKISEHNLLQMQLVRVMDRNVDIFLQNGIVKERLGPLEHELTEGLTIRGKLLDQIWEEVDEKELRSNLVNIIASKMIMQIIIKGQKEVLFKATNALLLDLRKIN